MQIFKTRKDSEPAITDKTDVIEAGCWIQLFGPTEEELFAVTQKCTIPPDFLKAALDDEERPRIDYEEGVALIVMDIPVTNANAEINNLTTHPLGVIMTNDHIITVCSRQTQILDDFIAGKVRHFSTIKKPGSCSRSFTGMLPTTSTICARSRNPSLVSKSIFTAP